MLLATLSVIDKNPKITPISKKRLLVNENMLLIPNGILLSYKIYNIMRFAFLWVIWKMLHRVKLVRVREKQKSKIFLTGYILQRKHIYKDTLTTFFFKFWNVFTFCI